MVRNLLDLKGMEAKELNDIIGLALKIKKDPGKYADSMRNRNLVMYFEKTSTRTRLSGHSGMTKMGGNTVFLERVSTQIPISEIGDEMKAVERYADFILARVLKHSTLEEISGKIGVPLINGCCEKYHPLQGIGDAMTMIEDGGPLRGKEIVWLGIGNNVCNSLISACTKLGAKISLMIGGWNSPSKDGGILREAGSSGLLREEEGFGALGSADYVHTDTWIDMEVMNNPKFREEKERRMKRYRRFQLNRKLYDSNGCRAKIMHCMPCHRGYEITGDMIGHPNSLIFEQAENRMWSLMALLIHLKEEG